MSDKGKDSLSRRSLIKACVALGALSPAQALAQFSFSIGGGSDNKGGFSLDLGNLFSAGESLFSSFDMDEDDEIRIGESLYPKLVAKSGGVYRNRRIQKAMRDFAAPLFSTSRRPRLKWEITVVNDNGVNAWTLPGGKIAVNKGLIRYTESADELAAVISHEIGHAELSHGLAQLKSKEFTKGLSALARTALSTQIKGAGSQMMTDALIEKLADPLFDMVTTGYSRPREFDADAHILKVFAGTGHDPAGASSFFRHLLEIAPPDSKATTSLFSTHPGTIERIRRLEAAAAGMRIQGQAGNDLAFRAMKRTFPTRRHYRRRQIREITAVPEPATSPEPVFSEPGGGER